MDHKSEIEKLIPIWHSLGYEFHYITIGELPLVFRTLTKREFESLSKISSVPSEASQLGPLYSEQYQPFIKSALLYPSSLPDTLPAAADKLVCEAIIEASGWTSTERLIDGLSAAREKALSLEEFLTSRVCTAFPSITPDKVQDFHFNEMMRMIALSEVMTGGQLDLQPWLDPEGYEQKMEKHLKRQERQKRAAQKAADPRMKDPRHRKRMMQLANEEYKIENQDGKIDFDKHNAYLGNI